jgi:hypothetical protein
VAKKLNRRSQQRLKRMQDSLENIVKFTNRIKIEELEELIRRDSIPVDSITGGSDFASGRSGSRSETSSVERAVIAREKHGEIKDPLREAVRNIEKLIARTEDNLRQVQGSMKALKDGVEKKRSTQTTEPCEICVVLPAVKTAMCLPCYVEWIDAGAPDRFKWKAFKRALTSSEGIPLVTEQPPARHTKPNA